jgi:cysteine synthase/rhodanese-related sulfurtransferase
MIYNSITQLIGNTPLLAIPPEVHGLKNINLYAKLELSNPFGSVKDRVAYAMLKKYETEIIESQKTVVESTSGNTGKALATLCSMHNISFETYTNRIKVPEIRTLLQHLGAKIVEFPGYSECSDPMDPNDPKKIALELAQKQPQKYHYTSQYNNQANIDAHYFGTGTEIMNDLDTVDYFIGVLGTCGSTIGAGKKIKEVSPQAKIIGIVSEPGSWVPGGRNLHELWEVGFFSREEYDEILDGNKEQAITGMTKLNRHVGLLCGPTTGLTYSCSLEYLRKIDTTLPTDTKVNAVFIACDRLESYMSYIQSNLGVHNSQSKVFVNTDVLDSAQSITSTELQLSVDSYLIIDTRSTYAFEIDAIPNSINIVDEVLVTLLEAGKIFNSSKPVLIVCGNGLLSKKIANFLCSQGSSAAYLEGGYSAWNKE